MNTIGQQLPICLKGSRGIFQLVTPWPSDTWAASWTPAGEGAGHTALPRSDRSPLRAWHQGACYQLHGRQEEEPHA